MQDGLIFLGYDAPKIPRDLSSDEAEAVAGRKMSGAEFSRRYAMIKFRLVDQERSVVTPIRVYVHRNGDMRFRDYEAEGRKRIMEALARLASA